MPYYISPAPAARVFTQAQPVFTFHARAARFHPLRRSGKKPSPAGDSETHPRQRRGFSFRCSLFSPFTRAPARFHPLRRSGKKAFTRRAECPGHLKNSPAPAARVFIQVQPVFTFHARAARFHPLRRSGKKPSPAGQNARGIQSPGRTPANSPGWSIEDAEPRVKPNNKQSPGRGGRKHRISILLRFLSPRNRNSARADRNRPWRAVEISLTGCRNCCPPFRRQQSLNSAASGCLFETLPPLRR